MKRNCRRFFTYLLGLFILTIGIGLSIKSDLGVSPVSAVPYTITLLTGLEMGKATILFHCLLLSAQILILRKEFKATRLFQLVSAIVFGYFTTFANHLVAFIPHTENYLLRLLIQCGSIICAAAGVFLYLPPDLIPLAGEGTMQAVAYKTKFQFSHVKIGFDCTMVIISSTLCLAVLHQLGSIGIGTLLSAVFTGVVLGFLMKQFDKKLKAFLA